MRKTLSCGLDEFQTYTNNVFQPVDEEDDDHTSSDSSPTSPRDSLFSQIEVKSSDAIFMSVMVTKVINLEEELINMKATLERLSKESKEKDTQIKHRNKQTVDLKKKLENGHVNRQTKAQTSEDSNKESNHSKEADDERNPKNESALNSMSIEHIQNLTTDAVKAYCNTLSVA